jgi:Ca-activated chloride channel family protein
VGETRFYRVRLGWGQRLAYRIGIPSQPGLGLQAGSLNATLASPLRKEAQQSTGSDSGILVGGGNDQELSGSTAAPVRYANRDSIRYQAEPYAIDGDYYLILDLSYPIGSEVPFSLPLTITVATEGGGAGPTYASDPATYSATPTTAAVAAPPARAEPASGRAGWVLAVAVVAGVAAVAALAWRRRRAQRAR